MGFPEQEEQISDLNIKDFLMHLDVSLTCSFCFSLLLDVTDEMLSFFLTLFQGLRVQMGVPFTEQIIQTFLNMFTRYCLTLVTSFIPLRMVYCRSCSATWSLSLKWAVPSLCGQTLSHPRAESDENNSKSGETPVHAHQSYLPLCNSSSPTDFLTVWGVELDSHIPS